LQGNLASPAVEWIDWERRIARLAAGATLAEINSQLSKQGWFLAAVSADAQTTLGAAIATDSSGLGRGPRGSIAAAASALEIVDGRGEIERLSGEDHTGPMFRATVAGLGLTGVVTSVEARITPISTTWMKLDTFRCPDWAATLAQCNLSSTTHPYSYAHIDLTARGDAVGRSIVQSGAHAGLKDVPDTRRGDALAFDLEPTNPGRGMTDRSPRWLQRTLARTAFSAEASHDVGLTPASRFFHPDTVSVSPLGPGRHNPPAVRYLACVPDDHVELLVEILHRIGALGCAAPVGTLRRHNAQSPGYLSAIIRGWSLEIDCGPPSLALGATLDELDERIAEVGGRVGLATDSRLRPELLEQMYPQLPEWQSIRRDLDPARVFNSDLARRLEL